MRVEQLADFPTVVVRVWRVTGCWRSYTAVEMALRTIDAMHLDKLTVSTVAVQRKGLRTFLVSIGFRRSRPFTTFGPAAFERLTEATSC